MVISYTIGLALVVILDGPKARAEKKKKKTYYMVYSTHYLGGVFVSFVYWAVF